MFHAYFFMCTILIPVTIINEVDKYRRHGLWRGSNINGKKPPQAAWTLACRPKREGGLGVINLRAHNEALLLKNLHKVYNRMDLPWVQLLWNQYYNNGQLPGLQYYIQHLPRAY